MEMTNSFLKKTALTGFVFLFCILSTKGLFAQSNPVTENVPLKYAMPILTVAPDARASGMGDLGAGAMPSVNDQAWNCSKYVFNDAQSGISLSYVPWMRNVGSSNINLLFLTGFYKLDDKQSLAASLRYFSLGDLQFVGSQGEPIRSASPNEFTLDLSYSRLLGEYFSLGAAFRYLRSDLVGGYYNDPNSPAEISAANGAAADLGFYFMAPQRMGRMMTEITAGVSITNIGTKMAYAYDKSTDKSYFLPTTLRLAGGLKMELDYYNELAVSLELSKYLVPTPPVRDASGNVIEGMDDNVSVPQGMIQSFYDAPGGFSEEMREIMCAVGVEYIYSRMFKARAGYYNDPKNAQHRYVTMGAGLVYTMFTLDLSYMIPVVSGFQSPLANTVHITFSVDFGKTQTRRSFERY